MIRINGKSVRAWIVRGFRWRVGLQWYVIAIGLPALAVLGGVGGGLALAGGPIELSVISDRVPLFVVSLVTATLIGGGQEEFGWRGFALQPLQETYGGLVASLLIGIVWATWHLPLFLMGAPRNQTGSFALYAVLVVGLSILLTWYYNSTGRSILLAMLFHGAINASGTLLPAPIETVTQWPTVIDIGMVAGVWVAAIVVVLGTDISTVSRDQDSNTSIADVVSSSRTDPDQPGGST